MNIFALDPYLHDGLVTYLGSALCRGHLFRQNGVPEANHHLCRLDRAHYQLIVLVRGKRRVEDQWKRSNLNA